MKRLVGAAVAVSGIILGIFVLNLVLFCLVPSYHDALEEAVAGDSHIPVVTVDNDNGNVVILYKKNNESTRINATQIADEDRVPLSSAAENIDSSFAGGEFEASAIGTIEAIRKETPDEIEPAPSIIDKEYHEDCGTGKGYWVIKYSDGSSEVQQY